MRVKEPIYKVKKSKKKPIYKIFGGEILASQHVSSQQKLGFIGSLLKKSLKWSIKKINTDNSYINIEQLIDDLLLQNPKINYKLQILEDKINKQINLSNLMVWNAIIGLIPFPIIPGLVRDANNSIYQFFKTIDALEEYDSLLRETYERFMEAKKKAEAKPEVQAAMAAARAAAATMAAETKAAAAVTATTLAKAAEEKAAEAKATAAKATAAKAVTAAPVTAAPEKGGRRKSKQKVKAESQSTRKKHKKRRLQKAKSES